MITKDFLIDIDFEKAKYVRNMRFVQGDTKSSALTLKLAKNGVPVDLTGLIVGVTFLRADNVKIVAEAHNTDAVAGEAKYVIANNIIDVPGQVLVSVAVYGNQGERLTHSVQFSFEVIEDLGVDAGQITADDRYPILTQLIADNSAIKTAEASRVLTEAARVTQETQRQDNEVIRQSQEQQRQTNTAAAIANANEATNSANSAAGNANNATGQLNIALAKADAAEKTMKVIPKTGVASYAAMLSTYPNPELGWLVHTLDTMKWWRWDGSSWINIATYNNEALDAVIAQVNTPLYSVPVETVSSVISIPSSARYGQLSLGLMGNTRTNLFQKLGTLPTNIAYNPSTDEYNCSTGSTADFITPILTVKTLTIYVVSFDIKSTEEFSAVTNTDSVRIVASSDGSIAGFLTGAITTNYKRMSISFISRANEAGIRFNIRNGLNKNITVKNILIEETNELRSYISTGTKSTLPQRVKSINENLVNDEIVLLNGYYALATGVYVSGGDNLAYPNMIRVEEGRTYTLRHYETSEVRVRAVHGYDENGIWKQLLAEGTTTSLSFTIPQGVKRIKYHFNQVGTRNKIKHKLYTNQNHAYIPHVFQSAYYQTPDGQSLRSLPNGTKDEIRTTDNGHEKVQRVNQRILQSSDVTSVFTGFSEIDYIIVNKPMDSLMYNSQATSLFGSNALEGYSELTSGSANTIDGIGKCRFTLNQTTFGVGITKGSMTLDQARTALTGLRLTYQLAQSQTIPVEVDGKVWCYPGGQVEFTPYFKRLVTYNNGITFDYPVSAIDKIKNKDGQEISNAVTLAADGKTATVSGITNETVLEVYAPYRSENSTLPTIRWSYPMNTAAEIESLGKAIMQMIQDFMNFKSLSIMSFMDINNRLIAGGH